MTTSRFRPAVAVNYHFVRPLRQSGRFQLRAHERPERFAEQVSALARDFQLVNCRELVANGLNAERPTALITFDDGARDVAEIALPVLEEHGATATVLVCSKPYIEGGLLQIQKVEYLMSKLGLERFRKVFYEEVAKRTAGELKRESLEFASGYRFYRYDDEPVRRFKLDLNYQLSYAIVEPVLDVLFEEVFGPGAEAEAVKETYMDADDLKRLRDAGIEVGTHTHSHKVLPRLRLADQMREIETSLEVLQDLIGERVTSIAYPFGFHTAETDQAAAELKLLAGLSGERSSIREDHIEGRWSIPRYDVNDCFDRESNAPTGALLAVLGRTEPASGTGLRG